MFKNGASQKLMVFAFDATSNLPKTGDAANITAYVSKDYGAVTVLTDTSATEMEATNGKGYYLFDLAQAETNADTLLFSAKSSTSNIVVIGAPAVVFTVAANFSSLSVDSNGRVDVIKVAGTTQTARDLGASVLLSPGTGTGQLDITSGVVNAKLADAVAHGGTLGSSTATLALSRMSVVSQSANTAALTTTGNGTGAGISASSGSGATGNGADFIAASTNGIGVDMRGVGTQPGLRTIGGATGNGTSMVGGATSGHGLSAAGTAGNSIGMRLLGVGTQAGLDVKGGATGAGIVAAGGDTSGTGISANGVGGNSVGIKANGQGSATGMQFNGGATGNGLEVNGGATSGDGVKVVTVSGHGVNLAPVGTSKHGIFATGGDGGTSDGMSLVAGTGGVSLRAPAVTAAITGNITGNLSGSVGSVTGAVGSVTGAVGSVTGAVGSVTGAVGSVTGNVGGNVTGSVGSVATGGIAAGSFAAGAVDAAAIAANAIGASELADGAIDAATFAASAIDATAIASNAITAAKIASDALTDAKFDSTGKLRSHFTAVLKGITAAGGSTTTIVLNAATGVDSGAPSATDDFYKGRVVVFTSGALSGQATSISSYAGATQTLTVVALTGAPAAAVTLVIV